MKLLLDENLSDKIIAGISDLFPDCAHVKQVALARADDGSIAEWAKHHDFVIVSKDTDFFQRSIVFGSPPKFIWLRVGNCQTDVIIALLRSEHAIIRDFIDNKTERVLVLERTT